VAQAAELGAQLQACRPPARQVHAHVAAQLGQGGVGQDRGSGRQHPHGGDSAGAGVEPAGELVGQGLAARGLQPGLGALRGGITQRGPEGGEHRRVGLCVQRAKLARELGGRRVQGAIGGCAQGLLRQVRGHGPVQLATLPGAQAGLVAGQPGRRARLGAGRLGLGRVARSGGLRRRARLLRLGLGRGCRAASRGLLCLGAQSASGSTGRLPAPARSTQRPHHVLIRAP